MDDETFTAERPGRRSQSVCHAAAVALAEHLGSGCKSEEAIALLAKALGHAADAFGLAKSLESAMFEVDDVLLQELLAWDAHLSEAHRSRVRAWVSAMSIQPQRAIGDSVTFKNRGNDVSGEITRVNTGEAAYVVFCPSLGHVREGLGTHGCVVPYEDVHNLAPSPDSFCLQG